VPGVAIFFSHKIQTSPKQTENSQTISNTMIFQSVLVIGASGRTGGQLIDQLAKRNGPSIHAFCRTPSKLSENLKSKCGRVYQGDAADWVALQHAINDCRADLVMISIGNGDNVGKSSIRADSAKALVTVLEKPEFQHVQAVAISSDGAGPTKIQVGFGIGKMIEFHLRHVLKDHTNQENILLSSGARDRILIVRPTALVDGKPNGNVVTFEDSEKSPTIETDRASLASWIVQKISFQRPATKFGAATVNVTCVKKPKQ
jgi:hypothetical protein